MNGQREGKSGVLTLEHDRAAFCPGGNLVPSVKNCGLLDIFRGHFEQESKFDPRKNLM